MKGIGYRPYEPPPPFEANPSAPTDGQPRTTVGQVYSTTNSQHNPPPPVFSTHLTGKSFKFIH